MKQWMRRFFAVMMMVCLLAGNAWAEKALDGNGLTGLQQRVKKPEVSSMADASMDNKSSAKATFEGGWLGVYDNNHLVTMAVCYIDDSIIAVASDKLREYAAHGTTLELYDFMEEKSYSVRVGKEENSVIRFVLDGAHDIPSLYMSRNVAYGETIGLSGGKLDGTISGFMQKDADGLTIMPEVVAATRPASGELFGTYSGSALAQGSPIFGSSSDGAVVMLGLADKNHRYLDLNAYYDLAEAAEHPTAAPTAAPTESPAAESPTQTVLYVIIGVLAAAVVALMFTRGKKSGGKNQQQETPTQRYQPENPPAVPDEPTKQLTVDEPKARVALECIGGNLQGMTFPISSRVVFGRDPKRCSIIYPKDAKGISGVHCAAEPTADGLIILTDLGSTYGTMVGGRQLTAGKGVTLHPGDTFTLGGSENRFTVRRL